MATEQEAESAMEKAFIESDKLKTNLAMRVKQINSERDEFVNDKTIEVVTDEYLKEHYGGYSGETIQDRKDFVENTLTLEQKLEILTEYNINRQILEGDNGIEVKLDDIAKRKKDAKEQFKGEALELIDMYNSTLDENKDRILQVEQDILSLKEQIKSAENKLQEIMLKDDKSIACAGRVSSEYKKPQAIKGLKEQITRLKGELAVKEKELEGLRQVQRKWEATFRTRKAEIETFLKAQNIYAYERAKSDEKIETTTDQNKNEEKKVKGENGLVPTKPRDVAKSMFQDFITSSPERQRKLLRQAGNEDILKMSRRLGPVNRQRLIVALRQRLDELSDESVTFTAANITKKKMKSMKDMSDNELKAIREEIDRFNNDFSKKSIDEIDEFEKKLDYIRIGALLHGTSRGIIRRFLDGFNTKANNIYELAKSTARYSTLKGERTTRKEEMLDRLRAKVSRSPMDEYTKSLERPLDRTGSDEFSR